MNYFAVRRTVGRLRLDVAGCVGLVGGLCRTIGWLACIKNNVCDPFTSGPARRNHCARNRNEP